MYEEASTLLQGHQAISPGQSPGSTVGAGRMDGRLAGEGGTAGRAAEAAVQSGSQVARTPWAGGYRVCARPLGATGAFQSWEQRRDMVNLVSWNHPAELRDISFFLFLVTSHGMWDLSSPTRDQTCALDNRSAGFNHWTTREVPVRLLNPEHVLLFSRTKITNFKRFVP